MRRTLFISLLAIALSGFLATRLLAEKAAYEYPNISIDDLKAAIADKKVTVIDANGSDSWKEAHIPGAIDFEANKKELAKVLPKEKDALIVAYCGGPPCIAYKAPATAASPSLPPDRPCFAGPSPPPGQPPACGAERL